MLTTQIKSTPEEAQRQWPVLTPHQKDMIRAAKRLGANLTVTVLSIGPMNLLFDLEVSNEPVNR